MLSAGCASIGRTGRKSASWNGASPRSPSDSTATAIGSRSPANIAARRIRSTGMPLARATASSMTPPSAPCRTSPSSTRTMNERSDVAGATEQVRQNAHTGLRRAAALDDREFIEGSIDVEQRQWLGAERIRAASQPRAPRGSPRNRCRCGLGASDPTTKRLRMEFRFDRCRRNTSASWLALSLRPAVAATRSEAAASSARFMALSMYYVAGYAGSLSSPSEVRYRDARGLDVITANKLTLPSRFKREWIVTNQYGRPYLSGYHLNQYLERAHVATGLRRREGPYPWRHTYASIGLTNGSNPAFLAKQLGHTKAVFFSTYARWIESDGDRRQLDLAVGKKRAPDVPAGTGDS